MLTKCVAGFLLSVMLSFAHADEAYVGTARIYKDDSGAQLTIAPFGPAEEKTYLVKFENFNNAWDDKVILHHFVQSATNKKYQIKVKTGKKLRPFDTFVSVVDSGRRTLLNGSIVPMVEVYLKGESNPHHLAQVAQDKEVSKALLAQYQKQTFTVDF